MLKRVVFYFSHIPDSRKFSWLIDMLLQHSISEQLLGFQIDVVAMDILESYCGT